MNMASAAPLRDIEENFFLCPVCLNLFKEPKILPCLHRYCKGCLNGILVEKKDTFDCPMCKQTFTKPENDAEGFKTDFHIKSVVQFIELQKSFELKEAKKCIGCKSMKTVSAYCFKCKGFLCAQCHNFHLDNEMVRDHRQYILDLKDAETKKFTLEKLASLREVPRCHLHAEHPAQLCCCSCGSVPVCVACTFGQHRGHDLHEVSTLAQTEREKLKGSLAELEKYKDNLYKTRRTIDAAKKELKVNVSREKQTLKSQYKKLARKIENDTILNDDAFGRRNSEERKRVSEACEQLNIEMKHELQLVREKYAEKINDEEATSNQQIEQFEHDHNLTGTQLAERTFILDNELGKLCRVIDDQEKQKGEEIQKTTQESEHILQRYKTFTTSASAILASKSDWTDVQYLPDIRSASEPLKTELVKMKVPAVKYLPVLTVDRLVIKGDDKVTITKEAQSVVNIKDTRSKYISGMEGCEDNKIVLTSNKDIMVINVSGDTVHRCRAVSHNEHYYSCSVSPCKVAIARSSDVRIVDVRDYSCIRQNITTDLPTGFTKMDVRSLAYDPDRKQILLGMCGSRKVIVVDEALRYRHTVVLPQKIGWPRDMTVHRGKLVICDESGSASFMVTMEGSKSDIEYEFTKPDNSASPLNVCTDKLGFIYMIWMSKKGRVVVQYSHNGRCLLAIRPVDNAYHITTLETEEGSKLLVASLPSQTTTKMHIYGLET